jgi:hypothetical protein
MAMPEQFLHAMDACTDAYDAEKKPETKRQLASAACLFAQVAEHLRRGNVLTDEIIKHCNDAASLIQDNQTRRNIDVLLSELVR